MSTLISVCVCTFRRPELLERLLDALAGQSSGRFDIEVVVIDNDPQASARACVKRVSERLVQMSIKYLVEPVPGVVFARNQSVLQSSGDFLAFIDDDEEPCEDWLNRLYTSLMDRGADAVLGPVVPVFPLGTPRWVEKSGFFDRPRFATGTPLPANQCRMGNVLIRKSSVPDHPFRDAFAGSGGEDTDFFLRIISAGASVLWVDEAPVSELVPFERQRISWMIARSLRTSSTYWQILYEHQPGWRVALSVCFGCMVFVPFALAGVVTLAMNVHWAFRLLRRSVAGLGRVIALLGLKSNAYAKGRGRGLS